MESFEAGAEGISAEQDGSGGKFSEGILDDDLGNSDPGTFGMTGGDGNSRPGVLNSRERFEKDEDISFLIRLRDCVMLALRSASENCGEGMGVDGGWLDAGKYCWNVCF